MTASARTSTPPLVALAGNPNTGKSSLFNALTGLRAKVGNYPGVTVDRRLGKLQTARGEVEVLDVPGSYSLVARSADEQIAVNALTGVDGPRPDVVVCCVDATQLARSLYLVVQAQELGTRVVIALTMVDEAKAAAPESARWARRSACRWSCRSSRPAQRPGLMRRSSPRSRALGPDLPARAGRVAARPLARRARPHRAGARGAAGELGRRSTRWRCGRCRASTTRTGSPAAPTACARRSARRCRRRTATRFDDEVIGWRARRGSTRRWPGALRAPGDRSRTERIDRGPAPPWSSASRVPRDDVRGVPVAVRLGRPGHRR